MAPQALATATTTAIAAVASTTYSTVAPLTTIWTPPAACASQIPTVIIGGTCNSQGCITYDAIAIASASWNAWLSFGYYTLGGVQVSTACAPPSTQVGDNFWYSPAKGCPSGYRTASSWSDYYAYTSSELSVVCCPSSYTSLETFDGGYGYTCLRYVTVPETMSMVAWGTIYGSDSAGEVTGTFGTISPISTTVVQPTRLDGLRPWVYAPAIQMVVSASGASTNPTTTAFSGYGVSTGNTTPFHIGPLTPTYSILVMVAAGLFSLTVACCCYCCCRSRPRPLRRYVPPAPAPAPVSVPAQICPHEISDSCRSSINNPCCACADKRSGRMSREARVQSYCIFCSLFWKAVPISLCPPEWELLGPRCAHNQNGSCEGEQESNSCCACLDKRREFLDLDLRVSNYCPPCRRVWEMKKTVDWPAMWGRPPVQLMPPPVKQKSLTIGAGSSKRPVSRKPTPTRKPPKQDRKAMTKEIELSILSRVSRGPEPEPTESTESAEDDGLRYGSPTLQVPLSQFGSQSGLPPSPITSPVATASTVSASIGPSRNSTSMMEVAERRKTSGLLYTAPKFSVPVDGGFT